MDSRHRHKQTVSKLSRFAEHACDKHFAGSSALVLASQCIVTNQIAQQLGMESRYDMVNAKCFMLNAKCFMLFVRNALC